MAPRLNPDGAAAAKTSCRLDPPTILWDVFAVEWEPRQIRWFVGDVEYFSVSEPAGVASDPAGWPFDQKHPFFIVVNLALGSSSDAPHQPVPEMPPQRLLVDHLRV